MERIRSLLRGEISSLRYLFLLVITIIVLPWAFGWYFRGDVQYTRNDDGEFKLGLENISDDFLQSLGSKELKVGLVANHASKDQLGSRNIDLLLALGLNIKKIITPQHGYQADVASGKVVKQIVDASTRIPVINLHDRQLELADIHDLDLIIFDLQDVGIKHYSYVNTLLQVMELGAAAHKTVVVLDRPNLLGNAIEGVFVESADSSGILALPMRYGMTIGELALYYKKQLFGGLTLRVVPMANYHRQLVSYKPIIGKLSPNIASLEACRGYSFLGVLGEVSPFDIGVGTNKAFQCLLLSERYRFPKQKWYALRTMLDSLGVEGSYYRYFNQRRKCYYSGLRLLVRDVNNFSLFKVLVTTLSFFKREGLSLGYSTRFEKIPGMARVKDLVEGVITQEDFDAELRQSLDTFLAVAVGSFMYHPLPKIIT